MLLCRRGRRREQRPKGKRKKRKEESTVLGAERGKRTRRSSSSRVGLLQRNGGLGRGFRFALVTDKIGSGGHNVPGLREGEERLIGGCWR